MRPLQLVCESVRRLIAGDVATMEVIQTAESQTYQPH
uniref:Uncharacterized protein n=1 Tax=Anguilla anguilla TaxID=7936 RepID=A0A0E9PMR5_ANGAN